MYQICLLGGPNYAQWLKCIATVYSVLRTDRPKTGSCSKKMQNVNFCSKALAYRKSSTQWDLVANVYHEFAVFGLWAHLGSQSSKGKFL